MLNSIFEATFQASNLLEFMHETIDIGVYRWNVLNGKH